MLSNEDTLLPPFSSYVNKDGSVNISSLGRAMYGLDLDDMYFSTSLSSSSQTTKRTYAEQEKTNERYDNTLVKLAPTDGAKMSYSSSSESSGREISVQATLSLPFSDKIASDKFTDLPQQSRWSPWFALGPCPTAV